MKKVFYVSLCVFVLVGIFWIAYNFVFRHNTSDPVADPAKIEEANEEEAAAPREMLLANPINEEILGTTIGNDDQIYYFSLSEKALKKATLEGRNKAVLLSNLPGFIERVLWSPRGDQALILIRKNNGELWHFADLSTKTLVPLRPEMGRLSWNNLGDKILYQFTDPKGGGRTLNIAEPDGSNWKKLADLSRDTYIAPIPKSTFLSLWSRPNALEKTLLETMSLTGSDRKTILTDKMGADYLWSPTGENILVSTTDPDGAGVGLALMNKNGGEYRMLSIPTLINKVIWSSDGDVIYYALPGSLPSGALLPNDYWSKSLSTQDTFWKMDLATGKKTRLVDLKDVTQSFDSTDLLLSPNEDALFFTERKTHRLYRIDL